MHLFQNIVAAVDFSMCSVDAVTQASRLASRCSAQLHVVHAIDRSILEELSAVVDRPIDEIIGETVAAARRDLERLVESAGAKGTGLDIAVGSPVHEVVEFARMREADLLVVGRLGASNASPSIGTFAAACARHAASTVLVVPRGQREAFRTIAVGVDFSETSGMALRMGVSLAELESAKVDAAHVYFGPWNQLHYRAPTIEVAPEFQAKYRETMETRLRKFVGSSVDHESAARVRPLLISDFNTPGLGLATHLRNSGTDLVIVGTHGRRGVSRLIMGSTAERVLLEATCAVMIVKGRARVRDKVA